MKDIKQCINPTEQNGKLYCETPEGLQPFVEPKTSPTSKALIGILGVILVLSALTIVAPSALFGGEGEVNTVIVDVYGPHNPIGGQYNNLDLAIQSEGSNTIYRVWDGDYPPNAPIPNLGYHPITASNIQIIGNGTGNTEIQPLMPSEGVFTYPLLDISGNGVSIVGVTLGFTGGGTNIFGPCIEIDNGGGPMDFSLENCEILDTFREGVKMGMVNNVHILNNTITVPNHGSNAAIFNTMSAPTSYNIYIDDNVITGGGRGINIYETIGELHITDNEINSVGDEGGTGINLFSLNTDELIVGGNTITGNTGGEDTGLSINYNLGTTDIISNSIYGYTTGINLASVDGGTIRDNMIDGASNVLLSMGASAVNNLIYRNIFLNAGNAYVSGTLEPNVWNETYENGGGNHWGIHTTPNVDEEPYFVDEPYTVGHDFGLNPHYDNLPWASPMLPDIWPPVDEYDSPFDFSWPDYTPGLGIPDDGDDEDIPPVFNRADMEEPENEEEQETIVGTSEVLMLLGVMVVGTISFLVIVRKK